MKNQVAKKKISLTTKRYKVSMDVKYLENILFSKSVLTQ
jgi:hypothetical protein